FKPTSTLVSSSTSSLPPAPTSSGAAGAVSGTVKSSVSRPSDGTIPSSSMVILESTSAAAVAASHGGGPSSVVGPSGVRTSAGVAGSSSPLKRPTSSGHGADTDHHHRLYHYQTAGSS